MKKDKGAAAVSVSGSQAMAFIKRHWDNNGSKLKRAIQQEFTINGRQAVMVSVENHKEKRIVIFVEDSSLEDIHDTIKWIGYPIIIIGTRKHIGPFLQDTSETSRYREVTGLNGVSRGILIKNTEKKYLYKSQTSEFGYKLVKELASFLFNLEKNILPNGKSFFCPQPRKVKKAVYRKQGYAHN